MPIMSGVAIGDVELVEASLDLCRQVGGADDVGPGVPRLARLVALGEHRDAHLPTGAVGQHQRASQLLVGVPDVEPEVHMCLDRLVELRAAHAPSAAARLERGVGPLSVHAARARTRSACRAVPSGLHLHSHRAGRAGDDEHRLVHVPRVEIRHLGLGDLPSWALESRPTFVRFGSAEPFSRFSASLMRTAAGGVLVMNVNERSSNTVISTGVMRPFWSAVWALNALQNSMMLTPCWPSAGPTGGAGFAWPPGI